MRSLITILAVLALGGIAAADNWYDTAGFELYNYGPINGQGVDPNVPAGWHDISSPQADIAVVSGTPGGH